MRSTFAAAALIGALVLVTTFIDAAPAAAKARTETRPVKIDVCVDNVSSVLCAQGHAVTHMTYRPNGDIQYTVNQDVCIAVRYSDDPRYDYDTCTKSHNTYVAKEGELRVYRYSEKGRYTVSGRTCAFEATYVYANGHVRIETDGLLCT